MGLLSPTPLVALVLDVLARKDGWTVDLARASHPTGLSIWIKDGPWRLAFRVDGMWAQPSGTMGEPVVIGMADRLRVWRGVQALQRALAEPVDPVAAFAERVAGFYEPGAAD